MVFDRAFRNIQLLRNLPVFKPVAHKPKHIYFARGQFRAVRKAKPAPDEIWADNEEMILKLSGLT